MKIRKNDDLLGVPQVRVIAATGEMLGVMPTADALRLAREQGLDLVEVNPRSEPSVCKIFDFEKLTFEAKKEAAARGVRVRSVNASAQRNRCGHLSHKRR